jgi:ABC-type phosphate transport system substrate-binding protein
VNRAPAGSRKARRLAGAGAFAVLAVGACFVGTARPAGATTTLAGEGGTFLSPVVNKLLLDAQGHLSGLSTGYLVNDFTAIDHFTGTTAPNTPPTSDFAVTETPLTPTQAATAKSFGRGFVYVPIAATPVAIGTYEPTSGYNASPTVDPNVLCAHIQMTVQDAAAIWGSDAAQPLLNWNDPRLKCSDGRSLYSLSIGSYGANLDPSMANFAFMTYLDSDPLAKSYFQAGVTAQAAQHHARTTSVAPAEDLPYDNGLFIAGGDQAFLGYILQINATTNAPRWVPSFPASDGTTINLIGSTFPVSSVWTGQPLGAPWNVPTAAIQNAAGSFVAPSADSAVAAASHSTLASTADPATDNLVTFSASSTDPAAYNSLMMVESYLVVPTSGIAGAKAAALADFIRFAVGPAGQRDIESLGAAPATTAMVAADLQVAAELDATAAQSGNGTSTSTTTPGATTSTTASSGGAGAGGTGTGTGGAADTSGGGGGTGSGSGAASPSLAFTGAPDLGPLVGIGLALLTAGALVRWRIHRRARRRAVGP